MKKNLLGVKIDDVSLDEATKIVEGWLSEKHQRYIVTPNSEILVMAQENKKLKKVLNLADLSVPDGMGLKLSSDIVCNTPGIELMDSLCKLASEKGFTIALLGGRDGVAKKASERLLEKYPKLKISFAEFGSEVSKDGKSLKLLKILKMPPLDLLFVAFGPPKQELWIAENLDKIPVKVAMGVGGAFDYLSGKIPRAPKLLRNIGLEWLFRLVVQPWRIKRQMALLKYLWLLTKEQ